MDGMMVSSSEPPQERTLFGSTSFKLDKSNNAEESDLFGSGSFKHDRSSNAEENEDDGHQWRFSKVSKTDSLPRNSVYSHGEGQMLSFASANTHNPSHSYYYTPSNHHPYFRNEGGMNANMQDAMGRARGPFTPSQWMELEHQALLYKYMAANAPIPQSLLLPLRRSLLSSPHFPPPFSSGYFSGYPLGGIGGYSLTSGVGGDAEPGRCRRTDGKKWRCSRDAVPDQKYCERHINRGRHRSRKHVEPQTQTQPRLSSSVTNKPTPATSSSPADVAARSALQRTSPSLYREEDNLSLLSPMLPFSSKNQSNGLSESSEFGTHTNLHHFMDETGTDQSYHRYQSWPELQDERTQLSISIPSLGGPLGEVLNKNCGAHDDAKEQGIKGGLNLLMGSGWDLDSDPQPEASPTGVLQKTGFGSLSSSAGSSPRLESYKAHDDLGSILVNHLSNLSSV